MAHFRFPILEHDPGRLGGRPRQPAYDFCPYHFSQCVIWSSGGRRTGLKSVPIV